MLLGQGKKFMFYETWFNGNAFGHCRAQFLSSSKTSWPFELELGIISLLGVPNVLCLRVLTVFGCVLIIGLY